MRVCVDFLEIEYKSVSESYNIEYTTEKLYISMNTNSFFLYTHLEYPAIVFYNLFTMFTYVYIMSHPTSLYLRYYQVRTTYVHIGKMQYVFYHKFFSIVIKGNK